MRVRFFVYMRPCWPALPRQQPIASGDAPIRGKMHHKHTCPNCGKQKDIRAETCAECYISQKRQSVQTYHCPQCGKKYAGRNDYCSVECAKLGRGRYVQVTC